MNRHNTHLFGDMLSSALLVADAGDCSADDGPRRLGGVVLDVGVSFDVVVDVDADVDVDDVTIGGAEAAK